MGKKKCLRLKIVFKKNNLPAFCGRLFFGYFSDVVCESLFQFGVAVGGIVAKLFFDADELVVLSHAVGAAE